MSLEDDARPDIAHCHFIGGNWCSNERRSESTSQALESTTPGRKTVVWTGEHADVATVHRAVDAARQASRSWRQTSLDRRVQVLEKFAEIVGRRSEELAQLISRETGKPLWEAKTEASAVAGKIPLAISAQQQRRSSSSFQMPDGSTAATHFRPQGVVAVLGPFNFPAHLPNGHIVPALIAGNTIVFKPSEMTPATGQWMVSVWQEAGLPGGVLNLVQGARDTGMALASCEQVDGLLFTGSSRAGTAIHRAFGGHPQKILALEMGGNNPLIVHDVSDFNAAAYQTVLSAYLTSGQRCTCARRLILVDGAEASAFVQSLTEAIDRVRVGFFDEHPEPFLGTVISEQAGRNLIDAHRTLVKNGAIPIVPLKQVRDCAALLSPGLVDVTGVEQREDEELFGPLLQIIRVPNFAAAILEANATRFGLSAGLLSDDRVCYEKFSSEIRAGVLNWNRPTTGASGRLPFGGWGLSGNHRPSGYFASDYCDQPVAAVETQELKLPEKTLTGFEMGQK